MHTFPAVWRSPIDLSSAVEIEITIALSRRVRGRANGYESCSYGRLSSRRRPARIDDQIRQRRSSICATEAPGARQPTAAGSKWPWTVPDVPGRAVR